MAQSPPDPKPGNLALRIRSALVFVPVVLLAIHFGFPWFDILIVFGGILMVWEWARICGSGRFTILGWTMEAALAAVLVVYYAASPFAASAVLALIVLAFGVAALTGARGTPGYLATGVGLVGAFCVAFIFVRAYPDSGRALTIWLIFAVWMTDTGAYFFGKSIGGPRLAPRISPKKTWAGLIGGALCSAIWSVFWLGDQLGTSAFPALAIGVLTSVLAQIGDLSVSVVKRRFGVKDASALIPGHGGVLDRLDGMLLTAPACALALAVLSTEKGWT